MRVIYYCRDEAMPIHFLLAYAKNAKIDLAADENRTVTTLSATLKATGKETT